MKSFYFGKENYPSSSTYLIKEPDLVLSCLSLCKGSCYLWNSFVYLGKTPTEDDEKRALENWIGESSLIVANLANNLVALGYKLYVDNWYTSKAVFQNLYKNKTCAAGTARKNRLKLPTSSKK